MSWDSALGGLSPLRLSEAESQRFGTSVSRLSLGTGWSQHFSTINEVADSVRTQFERCDSDVVIMRYPSEVAEFPSLSVPPGWRMLPAGSLMYWGAALESYVEAHLPNDMSSERLLDSASERSSGYGQRALEIITDSFNGYTNHYSANPLFDHKLVTAGYLEWAAKTISSPSGYACVLSQNDRIIGVATVVASEDDKGVDEIELAGLSGTAQGQGRYRYLLDAVVRSARDKGKRKIVISTQSHNIRVQRAWARAGLLPYLSVETVHCVRLGVETKRVQ